MNTGLEESQSVATNVPVRRTEWLSSGRAVLDADGDVLPTIGCVGVALAHLVEALREAGVDPPAKLTQALGAIADLTRAFWPTTARQGLRSCPWTRTRSARASRAEK